MASTRLPHFATKEKTLGFVQASIEKGHAVQENYRKIHDELLLSSVGMGSYLGEPSAEDDENMHDALVSAVTRHGLNVIDTAINYRYQRSEKTIGKALQTLNQEHGVSRESLFIASKNGFLTPDADSDEDFRTWFTRELLDTGAVKPSDIASGMHCMSPGYLEHQLNLSLENLGLETLDLMYLHNAAESQIPAVGEEVFFERLEQAFEFYEKARQLGKIRYYGLATWNCFRVQPDEDGYVSLAKVIQIAERVGGKEHGFRFIQFPFNLAMTEALTLNNQPVFEGRSSLLQAAQAFGIGVFTSIPLLQGQLLKEKLVTMDECKTNAQRCLQFVRSVPGIIAPLVGQKKAAHVQDNMTISTIEPMDFDRLQDTIQAFV